MSVSFQKLTIRLAYVREYMDVGPEIRRTRAKQLGMLMQAYRRDYAVEGQTGRLSQEGLLRLMGQADPRYRDRYDRSTVARWESGEIRPTKERIEVFGRALNLSSIEVEGLISLAGPDLQNGVLQTNGPEGLEGAGEGDGAPWQAAAADNNVIPSYAGEVMRFSLFRFLLPGSCIAGAGYLLVLQGWDSAWVLMLYVGAAIGLVLAQGFLILRRSRELRELFILSVFFLHSQSLLQAPLTRMENYGFYAIGDFGGTPIPCLLALIVNLFLALAAGLMFDFFWRWQYFGDRPERRAYRRAAWVVLPPIAFVYACVLVFAGVGAWIFALLVLAVLAGVFMTLLALRDKEVRLSEWDRKFLLWTAIAVTVVLAALAGGAILSFYLQPTLLILPDHNLFISWDVDFDALGYPMAEIRERFRLAGSLSSLATLAFMVVVVGGHLIMTIYRVNTGGSAVPAADASKSQLPPTLVGYDQRNRSQLVPQIWRRIWT